MARQPDGQAAGRLTRAGNPATAARTRVCVRVCIYIYIYIYIFNLFVYYFFPRVLSAPTQILEYRACFRMSLEYHAGIIGKALFRESS